MNRFNPLATSAAVLAALLSVPTHSRADGPLAPSLQTVKPATPPASLTVCLQPLGKYDKRLLGVSKKGIEYVYGFGVKVLPKRAMPKNAWYAKRKRWRADKLIDYISAHVVSGSGCDIVIGFTRHDISTTKGAVFDWGVLGLGELDGDTAVVSSFRMRGTSRRNRLKRAIKVVNHELGHVLGLPHYQGPHMGCLMSDAKGTVKTIDKETGLLCPDSIATIERHKRVRLPRHSKVDWRRLTSRAR